MEESGWPSSKNPNKAWSYLESRVTVEPVDYDIANVPPQPANTLRLVCISDTHNKTDDMKDLPAGDVLVHSGDFTSKGTPAQITHFNEYLKRQT